MKKILSLSLTFCLLSNFLCFASEQKKLLADEANLMLIKGKYQLSSIKKNSKSSYYELIFTSISKQKRKISIETTQKPANKFFNQDLYLEAIIFPLSKDRLMIKAQKIEIFKKNGTKKRIRQLQLLSSKSYKNSLPKENKNIRLIKKHPTTVDFLVL